MKKLAVLVSMVAMMGAVSFSAQARNTIAQYSLDVLQTDKAKSALLELPVYFAGQSHPAVAKKWGQIGTSRKTNAFMKSDQTACEWAFLSAVKALQQRALDDGYDAVVNIKSNYEHHEFASATEFECGAGAIMAGVALTGDMVKLKK